MSKRTKKPAAREYGMDVEWKAGEIGAFKEYNRLCREQAQAIFAANVAGKVPPAIIPAAELAARARAFAVTQ